MAGGTSPDGTDNGGDSSNNVHSSQADQVVQVRDVFGNLSIGSDPPRPRPQSASWSRPWLIVGLAVLLATNGVVWLWPTGSTPETESDQGAPSLSVIADLSANDNGPWGYASEDARFLGNNLVEKLSHPMAATDHALAREARLTGAASLRHQVIRLHLEGPQIGQVVVTDIRAAIRNKTSPLSGGLVWAPPQGPEDSAETLLELDDRFPVLQAAVRDDVHDRSFPAGPYFPSHTIKLAADETSEIIVTASATTAAYDYELTVIYQSGSELKEAVVNNNGKPFRVTGFSCGGKHVASYRSAYILQGDFSVTPGPNPQHLDVLPYC
ncbi:hypothetical protein Q5425_27895 [Amycolatopsis sp. A133]|uniref:hypothetical protein n=1 Tax=Amycolatopsis sp. A133 TaxID=3064472 RepID=UPI0027F621A8|nr:hypothetical protein [Amycolatopsis sp. A133]MDQ7807576.1 hypothetical protein [Amycolatopsis sp. A133]